MSGSSGKHANRPILHGLLTLPALDLADIGQRYLPGDRATQRLPLPLLAEQLQLVQLLGAERIAVAGLVVVGRQLVEQLFDGKINFYISSNVN